MPPVRASAYLQPSPTVYSALLTIKVGKMHDEGDEGMQEILVQVLELVLAIVGIMVLAAGLILGFTYFALWMGLKL